MPHVSVCSFQYFLYIFFILILTGLTSNLPVLFLLQSNMFQNSYIELVFSILKFSLFFTFLFSSETFYAFFFSFLKNHFNRVSVYIVFFSPGFYLSCFLAWLLIFYWIPDTMSEKMVEILISAIFLQRVYNFFLVGRVQVDELHSFKASLFQVCLNSKDLSSLVSQINIMTPCFLICIHFSFYFLRTLE